MKKILSALILVSLLLPTIILAAAPPPPAQVTGCTVRHIIPAGYTGFVCPAAANTFCDFTTPATPTWTCGACCLLDTIFTVTDWIFYIALAVAIIFIVLGAFTIITAGGSPEKVTSGRNYILYAVVGLIVGLAARALPAIARAIIGV